MEVISELPSKRGTTQGQRIKTVCLLLRAWWDRFICPDEELEVILVGNYKLELLVTGKQSVSQATYFHEQTKPLFLLGLLIPSWILQLNRLGWFHSPHGCSVTRDWVREAMSVSQTPRSAGMGCGEATSGVNSCRGTSSPEGVLAVVVGSRICLGHKQIYSCNCENLDLCRGTGIHHGATQGHSAITQGWASFPVHPGEGPLQGLPGQGHWAPKLSPKLVVPWWLLDRSSVWKQSSGWLEAGSEFALAVDYSFVPWRPLCSSRLS